MRPSQVRQNCREQFWTAEQARTRAGHGWIGTILPGLKPGWQVPGFDQQSCRAPEGLSVRALGEYRQESLIGYDDGGRSSAGRAPDCDSGRRGFESHRPPHLNATAGTPCHHRRVQSKKRGFCFVPTSGKETACGVRPVPMVDALARTPCHDQRAANVVFSTPESGSIPYVCTSDCVAAALTGVRVRRHAVAHVGR